MIIEENYKSIQKPFITYLFLYFCVSTVFSGEYKSYITLKIKGKGILYYFNGPRCSQYKGESISEIYLDEMRGNEGVNYVTTEADREYVIKLVWNVKVTSCQYMFNCNGNITEVDLSNFDAS